MARRSIRDAGAVIACLVLGVSIIRVVWLERYDASSAVVAGVAFLALAVRTGWWQAHRALLVTLGLNIAACLLAVWSLDEHQHIVIRAANGRYFASVDGTSLDVAQPTTISRLGLSSGALEDYRVGPTGEVLWSPDSTLVSRLGAWMRLVAAPAWDNFRVTVPGRAQSTAPIVQPVFGSWTRNRRGEYVGSLSSAAFVSTLPRLDFTVEVDLMRGDGTQGIVFSPGAAFQGVCLQIRTDRPDAQWVPWTTDTSAGALASANTRPTIIPMLQRDIRLLLGNYAVAAAYIVLALLAYVILLASFRLVGGRDDGEAMPIERFLYESRVVTGLAVTVAVVSVLSTAWVSVVLLERIPHVQDSVADLFQAKTFALGRLWVPEPRLTTFFNEEFIPFHNGRWFGKYPPGWPLLLALGVIIHAPWLINPILSGANIILIFLIGRAVYGPIIGLAGAALTLTSPFFLFLGASFMPHTSTLFYVLGGLYLVVRRYQHTKVGIAPRSGSLLIAGFLLGMAFMTRQIDAIAFFLPFAVLFGPDVRARRTTALLHFVIGGGVPLIALLGYNWLLTGNPITSPYSLWWPFDRVGFGPKIGFSGFTPAQGLWNTSFNLQMLLVHLYGWPFFTAMALAVIPFVLGRACLFDWLLAASVGCVIVAYIAYWNPGVMFGPRYYFTVIPAIGLLSVRGVQELYSLPLRIGLPWQTDRIAASAVPSCILAILFTYNLAVYLPAQIPIYRGYNYTSAASINAVATAGIHHALVFVVSNPPGEWWSYGAVFSSNSPLLDGDVVYARDQGLNNRQLMLQYPHRAYYLLNSTTLTRLQL